MRKMTRILVLSLISIIGLSSAALGGTITKTFELGEGTANSVSNKRTFEVPCGLNVSASVKYSRKGTAAAENDVPLTITLIKPAEGSGEGDIAQTKQVTAKTTPQNVSLSSGFSNLGCVAPWSVRVKPTNGTSSLAVYGEISVTFDDSTKGLTIESNGSINLNSGNSVEKNISFGSTGGQGLFEIKGRWYHNLGTMPIRMKFELINPEGEVVKSDTGFAENEVNPCCSGNKLKITYLNPVFSTGPWKLRITNMSEGHDAVRINVGAVSTIKPKCP